MTKKKTIKKEKTEQMKQYSVFHMAGEQLNRTNGDSYHVMIMDARSPATNEIMMFPVIYVINDEVGSTHIIPLTSVVDLVYNYGFEEQVEEFKTKFKKMKEKKEEEEKCEKKCEEHLRDVT